MKPMVIFCFNQWNYLFVLFICTDIYLDSEILANDSKDDMNKVTLLATSLMALGQYQRCSLLLRRHHTHYNNNSNVNSISSKYGLFLACYSHYLAGNAST